MPCAALFLNPETVRFGFCKRSPLSALKKTGGLISGEVKALLSRKGMGGGGGSHSKLAKVKQGKEQDSQVLEESFR